MLNKKQHLKKKYKSLENKDFTSYIYLPPLKANELRKVRRYSKANGIDFFFLPSSFFFTNIPMSQGPAIICINFKNLGFSELNLANLHQNLSYILGNKYQIHLSFEKKYESTYDFAKAFATTLHQNKEKF